MVCDDVTQVSASGGPQPQSSIEFSIADQKVGTVTSAGLVEALELGTTRLRGRSVGVNGADNTLVVYSEVSLHTGRLL